MGCSNCGHDPWMDRRRNVRFEYDRFDRDRFDRHRRSPMPNPYERRRRYDREFDRNWRRRHEQGGLFGFPRW